MFDIGFWELILIAVLALVILGPQRMPVAVKTVGRWVRTFKGMANQVRMELERELHTQELHENLKKAEQMGMKDLPKHLDDSVKELKQHADDLQRPYGDKKDKDE
ncbi:Sec-independent protein translocase protein TatB [Gallaecimonas sp. GXIMD4217]|uniref:Sec-independent protein translocase protein TatB n=1 Tax=Gallaecimonas sp. GXIMD4217 TaxID=3131927 RepID=UPI00311B2737